MLYNPYNFFKDSNNKKNELRPRLKIAANYSRKVGKAILETRYIKKESHRGACPPPPLKTRTFGTCNVPPSIISTCYVYSTGCTLICYVS